MELRLLPPEQLLLLVEIHHLNVDVQLKFEGLQGLFQRPVKRASCSSQRMLPPMGCSATWPKVNERPVWAESIVVVYHKVVTLPAASPQGRFEPCSVIVLR